LLLTFQNDHVFHVTRKISVYSIVCISPVPSARFVMLDLELEREFSMKVIERKSLTHSVVGGFDLSMLP